MASRPDTSTTGRHIPALDGLRGVAILMVMMLHLLWANNNPEGGPAVRFFARFISCGSLGVDLFFALSGFLITGILFDTLHGSHFFRNFFARRSLRVFPLYYGYIAVLVLISYARSEHWHLGILRFLTYNLYKPDAPVTDAHWVNIAHFWSLAVEEQFYLCWPLAVYVLRTKRKIASVAVIVSLLSFGLRCYIQLSGLAKHDPYLAYDWTPARLDGLLLGSTLAILVRSHYRGTVLKFGPAALAAGAASLAAYGLTAGSLGRAGDPFMQTFGFLIAAIASCGAISSAMRAGSWIARCLQAAPLQFFGRYSYGLYVVHYTFAAALSDVRPWIANATHSKLLGVLGGAAVVLAVSLVTAMLSFRFFEKPILSLKRHFQDDSPTPKLHHQLETPAPAAA